MRIVNVDGTGGCQRPEDKFVHRKGKVQRFREENALRVQSPSIINYPVFPSTVLITPPLPPQGETVLYLRQVSYHVLNMYIACPCF